LNCDVESPRTAIPSTPNTLPGLAEFSAFFAAVTLFLTCRMRALAVVAVDAESVEAELRGTHASITELRNCVIRHTFAVGGRDVDSSPPGYSKSDKIKLVCVERSCEV